MTVKLITTGLAKIEIGDVLTDGSMGTSLTQYGYTDKDSCEFTTDDPTETVFEAEEADDPIHISYKGGKKQVKFNIADPDEAAMALFMGGTAVSTPGAETYEAPSTFTVVEKSIKITPVEGIILSIPRGNIVAKLTGKFAKSDKLKLECTATILTPTKDGLAPFSTTRVSAT
jgi:hypothetical protein